MTAIKQALYQKCIEYVAKRIETAQIAMQEAQASANAETKSTAGDKHDTARAMMQLAAGQNARHLAEANKLNQALQLINPEATHSKVEPGSVVTASNGVFFISISAGKIELDDKIYFAVSPISPIGNALLGLKTGEHTTFNQQKIEIKNIF